MTAITVDNTLLEQMLDALEAAKNGLLWYQDTYPDATNDSDDEAMGKIDSALETLRAELAKPVEASYTATQLAAMVLSDCGISTDYAALHMLVAARIARHEEELIDSLKKLAKPVEQDAQITLDQFRAIAHRTATTYRHRTDPEKSSYAFVDGSSLDDFWRKVCEAIQPTPAQHDAPETLALKAERDALRKDAERYRWLREHFRFANDSMRELWFDPVLEPNDSGVPDDLDQKIDHAMSGANA